MFDAGSPTAVARFWAKVNKNGPIPEHHPELGPCWLWTAASRKGYGIFHPRKHETTKAHRWSLSLELDEAVPPDRDVLHHCDTPLCVRPTHLRTGGDAENSADKVARGRHKHGEMDPQAKLTDAQVVEMRERAAAGERNRSLAADYGVGEALVSMVVSGKRWKHLGGPRSTKYKTRTRGQSSWLATPSSPSSGT